MQLAHQKLLNFCLGESGSVISAEERERRQKALAFTGGLGTALGLAAASAVGSNPLVFTPDEYSIGNVGDPDQYVDVVLPDGTVVRLPAGHYVISPEGLLVPLINGTDDPDGDGLTNLEEDTNANGNWFDDDADGDLVPDFLDSLLPPSDTNEDGLSDALEDVDGNGSALNDDTDSDNIPNYADEEKLIPNDISARFAEYKLPTLEEAGFSFGNHWSLSALSFAGAGASVVFLNETRVPKFDPVPETYVSEDATTGTGPDGEAGTTAGAVLDIDAYKPGNSTADADITYSIIGGNDDGAFAIDAAGLITVADAYVIDFETQPTYELKVKAVDNKGRSNSITVTINVDDVALDVTPSAPSSLSNTITEDDVNSSSVALGAIPAQQQWELSSGALNAGMTLDSAGNLNLGIIDLENLPSGVTSVPGGGGGVGGSATLTIPIKVTTITGETSTYNATVIVDGIHDEDPVYISGSSPVLSLPENEDGTAAGGYAVGSVAGTFDDGEATPGTVITYSLIGAPAGYSISGTGEITYLNAGISYDYEVGPTTESLTVRATDASGATTDRTFTVTISDENPTQDDGSPNPLPTSGSPTTVDVDNTQHWSTIFDVEMTEGTNDNHDTGVSYSITSGATDDGAQFGISSSGEIYLMCLPNADPPTGTYPHEVVVQALETGGDSVTTQSFWIDLQ